MTSSMEVVGDIVTKLNGEPVTGFQSLRTLLFVHQAGETVTVGILRNGEAREFKVVLQKRPTAR